VPDPVHEAYHTLVFKAKWEPEDAARTLLDACSDRRNAFVNQTVRTARAGLELAVRYRLGGRDALIIASLLGAKVREFFTFDKSLLELKRIRFGKSFLVMKPA
jgi:predicted nucleic acid-binding protein